MTLPLAFYEDRPTQLGKATVGYIKTNDILTKASGFIGGADGFDFTLNPYSGCTFGCSYCYAGFFQKSQVKRDTWGDWVAVKENAATSLRKHKRGSLDGALIYMSSVTDPYQPIEKKLEITRSVLETLVDRGDKAKLVVQTRGPGVVRDIDLFKRIIDNGGLVQVNMTITTDDEEVRRVFEPHCSSNVARLKAIQEVQVAGVQTCITMTPLLIVQDAGVFADMLNTTNIQRFITQPFHATRDNLLYPAASTKEQALQLMADKLECSIDDVNRQYRKNYDHALRVFKQKLPNIGEGKAGFRPPF